MHTDRAVRPWSIALWMLLVLAAIAALATWDADREWTDALDDFAREQTTVARALATAGATDAFRATERPQLVRVLVLQQRGGAIVGTSGAVVGAPFLRDAIASGQPSLRLTREQAASLDLPRRMAMAGFATIESGLDKGGTVIVVASAQRERDRERRAFWRLLLSVSLAATLLVVLGVLFLRQQREELALKHDLAIVTIQDERDRKLAVADKIATMGALATGIAHEVSTPLNVIVGRAEQLQARAVDEKDRRAIAAILEQSSRISSIIRGLLGLARGDSPSFEKVPASSLATKAKELVQHRFEKGEVALDVDVPEDLPRVACDPRLFEQALVNLLLNACDACAPGGHVTLQIAEEAKRVRFSVDDDGEGITPEAAARATEAFFTTKPAGHGTGLGLAIAREIVKHHGGTLVIAPHDDPKQPGTHARIEVPTVEETSDA